MVTVATAPSFSPVQSHVKALALPSGAHARLCNHAARLQRHRGGRILVRRRRLAVAARAGRHLHTACLSPLTCLTLLPSWNFQWISCSPWAAPFLARYWGDAASPLAADDLAANSFFTGSRVPIHRVLVRPRQRWVWVCMPIYCIGNCSCFCRAAGWSNSWLVPPSA